MMLVNKSQLIEVVMNGTAANPFNNTTINFGIQQFLLGKKIEGLEFYCVDDIPQAPSGAAVVSRAVFKSAFLTLYMKDPDSNSWGEYIQNFPLTSLRRINNPNSGTTVGNVWQITGLRGVEVDWDKSKIFMCAAPNLTVNTSFILNVYYAGKVSGTQVR